MFQYAANEIPSKSHLCFPPFSFKSIWRPHNCIFLLFSIEYGVVFVCSVWLLSVTFVKHWQYKVYCIIFASRSCLKTEQLNLYWWVWFKKSLFFFFLKSPLKIYLFWSGLEWDCVFLFVKSHNLVWDQTKMMQSWRYSAFVMF